MNKKKRYDNSFKRDAVNFVFSSKQSLSRAASELGIAQSTLSRWAHNSQLGRHINLSDNSPLKPEEAELKKVLKELAIVKEERDILKKALGIFSLPQNR